MRLIGQTLVTKGIVGIRKAVSLATKGILDAIGVKKGGGTSEPRYVFISLSYNVIGQKIFSIDKILTVIGTKVIELQEFIALEGQKVFMFGFYKELIANLEKLFFIDKLIEGKKIHELNKQLKFVGQKEISLELIKSLIAKKQFDLIKSNYINAEKIFKFEKENNINGSKETILGNKILIKGKKDLSPILAALDLL